MTSAPEPRFLPPAADDFVFDPALAVENRLHLVPRYGDDGWSLLALTRNPSATNDIIRWTWFSDAFRETFRHASWTVINHPLPDQDVARHGAAMRSRLGAGRLLKTVNEWSVFAAWLDEHRIGRLSQVTTADLADFALHLDRKRGLARNTASSYLIALSRLHYYGDYLPPGDRLTEPPWVSEGMDDYLPAASPLGENVTEPISPAVMGPLLVWSLRFVEEYATDIITAYGEHCRLAAAANALKGPLGPGSQDGLVAFLEQLEAAGRPVPVVMAPNKPIAVAGMFLAAKTGTPAAKIYQTMALPRWREYTARHHGPCLLDTPVTAQLGGRPWHEPFDFHTASTLARHLVTACFIVLGYLTGMRTGEILGLRTGCCPEPQGLPDAAGRHLIYGRVFKIAKDADGNHASAGVVREAPWVAVPQAVTAVRVLEQLTQDGLLFAAEIHDPRRPDLRSGRSLGISTMSNRIERFVDWVNTHAETRGRTPETIPDDPHGRIGTGRFRRTLAWHIARRPGGLIALAVQYGHMRTLISQGYSSRARGGIHDLLDFETARTIAEQLSDVHEALQDGHGISGPAARRLIHSAAQEHHRFGGIITSVRQARTLLEDPTLNVFENKEAFLFCNYDRTKALCHPARGNNNDTPSLDRCKSNCANIARTDDHAHQLRQTADHLNRQADSGLTPQPLADRLRERAKTLSVLADKHDTDRITPRTETG